ncbi:hypothetical protein [Pseudomonas fluorescens]|uniref:hypothetical protein n=1 Tax=Pseudomonas fluorescens TaxID=294 RepID=UPI000AA9EFF3|nr:hypothetical protein [Pseudomonas fluorescens]
MSLKGAALLLCPPLITKIASRIIRRAEVFSSYSSALESCGPGYNSSVIARVVVEKNKRVRDLALRGRAEFDMSSLRALSAIVACSDHETINVLDFGGGGGYHYFFISSIVAGRKKIRWCVAETEEMVAAAKELESTELFFEDSIEKASSRLGRVDFVLACGSIHCTPDPMSFLSKLISIGADRLFITRSPIVDAENPPVVIQSSMLSSNGPGPLPEGFDDVEIKYPLTVMSRSKVEDLILSSYFIQSSLAEEKRVYFVNGKFIDNYGYFCLKK